MKVSWLSGAVVALAFLAGAGALWLYQREAGLRSYRAAVLLEQQRAEVDCPIAIDEADALAIAEYKEGHADRAAAVVSRGSTQRAYAASVDGRMVVAGELTARVPGPQGYSMPLRYIRRPYGTVSITFGDRFRDAEFEDTWFSIVRNTLCIEYD